MSGGSIETKPQAVPTSKELQVFQDVACTVCGCVCDDLTISIRDRQIVDVDRACVLAKPWFDALSEATVATTLTGSVVAEVQGNTASLEAAIGAASEILKNSRSPLIYGLSRSSTPGQQAAVELADLLRASIDTTASVCHGPSIMAIQQAGESTCTLGEVRQRADLVIFWGANPATTHPRHFERYSLDPASDFLPGGRKDRTVIVVDVKPETETSLRADQLIQVDRGRDFEMILALRQLIRNPDADVQVDCGVALEELRELAAKMKSCRYGIVFFGLGIAQRKLGHLTVDALLRLVADLNAHTRFTARRLRIPGDVSGADSVLCWQTGFPFGVSFQRGYPRYNPGEFTANDLLEREEVDACLIIGSESVSQFSAKAKATLQRIPTIVLDYPHVSPFSPTIRFTTAVYGLEAEGTAYRMDEVPIPLRKLRESPFPADDEVLKSIIQKLSL